jgi:hypothetical protein
MISTIELADMVKMLPYDKLIHLLQDIETGGNQLRFMLQERIKELEKTKQKVCASCGIEFSSDAPYTMVFGPVDMRKKASFCGLDCMNTFTKQLEELKHYDKRFD